jgi:segregation and condensation protein A
MAFEPTDDLAAAAGEPEHRLRVSFDVFDGPLDLLLHLVREQKLDIVTVPLASVAKQYFDYIAVMDAMQVELAAEYLVIAATLVFLKSKSLLPAIPAAFVPEGEETAEEVEERLRRRLIAYSKYKGVADDLRARQAEAEAFYYRETGDPANDYVQRYRLGPDRLVRALLAAVREAKPEKRVIARERFSIARQMEFVLQALRDRGSVDFREVCRDLDRGGIIATFLAVLELIRQRRIAYEQAAPEDELRLLPPEALDTEPLEPIHAN